MANLIETFALVVAVLAGKIGHSRLLPPRGCENACVTDFINKIKWL